MIYLLVINLFAFSLMGIDKYKAKHDYYRISELFLMSLALCGGSIGILSGMYCFHHKTLKPKFKFGIPLILVLQLIVYLIK